MTTPTTPVDEALSQTPDEISFPDLLSMIRAMAAANEASGDAPRPAVAGTFALYPMADGGLMFVTDVADGPLAGIKHNRISPALIRAAGALGGGGSKLGAVKALIGRGK